MLMKRFTSKELLPNYMHDTGIDKESQINFFGITFADKFQFEKYIAIL